MAGESHEAHVNARDKVEEQPDNDNGSKSTRKLAGTKGLKDEENDQNGTRHPDDGVDRNCWPHHLQTYDFRVGSGRIMARVQVWGEHQP